MISAIDIWISVMIIYPVKKYSTSMCFQIDGQLIECVPPRLKNTPNKFFPEKSCAGIHCPWSTHTPTVHAKVI